MTDSTDDVKGYFALLDELRAVDGKFNAQKWVQALLIHREADNRRCLPIEGREYPVTQAQYVQARAFLRQSDPVKLFGYTLIPGDN